MPAPAASGDSAPEDYEEDLLRLFRDLRPASRYHLMQALAAQDVDGVTGTLVVKIPRKAGPVDVSFIGGQVKLTLEP